MCEDEVPSADLDRSEGVAERVEQAGSPSEEKLARAAAARRERDRAAAFEAWRRWP